MNDSEAFYMLVEKVCTYYDIDSMYQDSFTRRGFVNQVHEASEGNILKRDMHKWIDKFGMRKVFEKVIFVFGRGTPYGSHLNKALYADWAWSPSMLLEPKYVEPMRIDNGIRPVGEMI